jgi:modification methylase
MVARTAAAVKIEEKEELPLNSILLGDCVEMMAGLPDKSVDLIFADPPYNLQLQNELWRPNMTLVDAVDDDWDKFDSFEAYDNFTRRWLTECRRVLKDTGTIWVIGSYHNIYRVGSIMMDLGFWILNDVVFIKLNPMPNFRGVRFTNAHETLLWCKKSKQQKRYTFNYQQMKQINDEKQMRSDWEIALCTGSERLKINGEKAHNTQKPEALLYRVILSSTLPGDIVLDPFFGTGTTGAVARKLHRNWIGIERNPVYVGVAQERIEAVRQTHLDFEVFPFQNKRTQPRIPFAALLENGLLNPGTKLYYARPGRQKTISVAGDGSATVPAATIRADSSLKCGEYEGSIHAVGSKVGGAPSCNGWDHWWYLGEDGAFHSIDELRVAFRERQKENMPNGEPS